MSQQKGRSDVTKSESRFETVGKREHRTDALGKVTGNTDYTGDIPFDELAHAKLIRSSVAHANIKSVDISSAEAMEGVIKVVLPNDIPGEVKIGSIVPDQPLLNRDKVRYLGDPIGIVVAESEKIARRAADSVNIEYKRLSAAFDAEETLAEGAESIHDSGNLIDEYEYQRGDPKSVFDDADLVVEESFQSSMIDHVPLEPEATVAHRTFEDTLEVWTSTQHPHGDRQSIARVLGLRERDIEITRPAVGGGFGSKLEHNQPCYAALASWMTKRPVRVRYSRDEEFQGTVKRNTLTLDYRVASDNDGSLRAFDIDITVDGGAYVSFSSGVAVRALVHCTGPYYVDAIDATSRAVYTNKPWGGAMRSFDMFQTTFAIESIIDRIADELDISPIDIRRRNAFDGSEPAPTTGQRIEHVGLPETIEDVATDLEAVDLEQPDDPSKRRGVGMASMWYGCGETGHHHPSSAFCEIHTDGTVAVQCAAAEIGQGSDTALVQIAAETLGLQTEDVKLITDSTVAPNANETSASRQTFVSGNAVRLATEDALETVLEYAARLLAQKFDVMADAADLELREGRIRPQSGPDDHSVSFEEAVRACNNDGILITGTAAFTPLFDFDISTFKGSPYPTFAFATHGAVVEVDIETGVISVEEIFTSHDVGQAINPALVEGQIEGGAVMGMGHTIMEEMKFDSQGQILNASLMDYHIPTSLHAPEITTHLVESAPDDDGPYGAKGVGESALIPIGPAIANAVRDATGVGITELPLSAERVISSLPDSLTDELYHSQ